MRAFLTGGTGYLGGRIARALLDGGHEVAALVRNPEAGASLLGAGAELVEGRLEQPDLWESRLLEAEALVHTAGLVASSGPDPGTFDRINIHATLDLVERAQAGGLERVLVTGSLFALGPSPEDVVEDESALDRAPGELHTANDYVRTKTTASRKLRERQRRGNPVMMVFPTVLLGPGALTAGNHTASIIGDIGHKKLPGMIGTGDQVWNLVPVDSAARGHVLALERGEPGENYILGGENWTQRRLVECAARAFGVKPPTRALGRRLPMAVAKAAEIWSAVSGRPPRLTRGEVHLYDAHWSFSSAKAEAGLGYRAESVEETITATVAWLRDSVWRQEE